MYYRRKIILSLLEEFGGKLKKIDFQKLLMILSAKQDKPAYEFVPYKFGCFSFQSYADIRTMIKYKQILENTNDECWVKNDKIDYFQMLKDRDQFLVKKIKEKFENYSSEDLIKYTYREYPYYAIKSTIAEKVLTKSELKNVEKEIPVNNQKALFTIGYEGISQENYLNKLIKNDIKVLCDVRRNALSMKYGFSKNQLLKACTGLGIEYFHIPEVGIESNKRKELKSQKDYDELFASYNMTLRNDHSVKGINEIIELLNQNERVAITCFEANIHQCHRKHLAIKLVKKLKRFDLVHI